MDYLTKVTHHNSHRSQSVNYIAPLKKKLQKIITIELKYSQSCMVQLLSILLSTMCVIGFKATWNNVPQRNTV